MSKRVLFVLLGLVILVASLSAMKALQIGAMVKQGKEFIPPPVTVTAAVVATESWSEDLTSVGTLSAVQGVTVSAELSGKVVKIAFESGAFIRKGDLLVRQDTSSEEAQLPGAAAGAELARLNRERADRMMLEKILSQADHDATVAAQEQAQAQVNNIRANLDKKTVRAPFSGRVGVRQVNLGQMLREGDPIVSLQTLDPIFVDFNLPQQQLAQVRPGKQCGWSATPCRARRSTGRSRPSAPWWTAKPAISRFRQHCPTARKACGQGCSSLWQSVCRSANRCRPFQPRPSSMPPIATRSSSLRKARMAKMFRCASSSSG
jgi:biotin carboxyl carrier protein